MRSYHRLLILNLAFMVPLTAAIFLHVVGKLVLLVVQLALLFGNYVSTRKASIPENGEWGLDLWWAWISGP